MPVHRHVHGRRGTIYAFTDEIEEWLESRTVATLPVRLQGSAASHAVSPPALDAHVRRNPGRPIVVAVLPLKNLRGNASQWQFAEGLAEEVVLKLAGHSSRRLRVVSFAAVLHHLRSGKSVARLGRDLRADFILEVGGRRRDGHMNVNISLVDSRSHVDVWAESFELTLPSLLSLQRQFAGLVADRLSETLGLRTQEPGLHGLAKQSAG